MNSPCRVVCLLVSVCIRFLLTIGPTSALLLSPTSFCAASQHNVAIGKGIQGGCVLESSSDYLMRAGPHAREITIPSTKAFRLLQPGNEVKVKDGKLKLHLYGRTIPLILTKKDGWFPIPFATRESQVPVDTALAHIFAGTPGRPRRDVDFVYSPPCERGAVDLRTFVFRWNPVPGHIVLSISSADVVLQAPAWSEEVDGKLGRYDSAEARKALTRFRQEHPGTEARLRVTGEAGNPLTIDFAILSEQDEVQMDNVLRTLDSSEATLRHLGRADVRSTYRLYTEAAEELEAALELSPASSDLLLAAYEAQSKSGNVLRAGQIEKKLPPNLLDAKQKP